MSEGPGRISLEDKSDPQLPTDKSNMSEGQGTTESATQDKKGGAQPQEEGGPLPAVSSLPSSLLTTAGSWLDKSEGFGNKAGETIQGYLNPVGQYTGKGLETVAKPIGGIVDPIAGGIMRSGEAFGEQAGVGFGNKEGGPAKQQEAEGQRLKEGLGGKEQNADNPLGL